MPTPLRVLILEDSPTDAEVMLFHLREAGYAPEWQRVETEADYLAHLEPTLDIILVDYTLPDFTARQALQLLQARDWDIPAIVVTGTVGEETALECLRLGAADYLLKDRLTRLGAAVSSALAQRSVRRERAAAQAAIQESEGRYRRFFEGAVLGIFQSTPDGKILDINPAYARMFDYASPEELKQVVNDVATNLYAEPARRGEVVKKIMESRAPIVAEILYRRRDGSTFPGLLHAWAVRDEADRFLYLEGFVEDITERKRAEEGLARRTFQLEAVRMVNEEIARELDLTALLELITQRAVDLVGAGEGTIRLWDEAEQILVPKAWTGSIARRVVPPLRLGEGVAGTAAQRREGLIVNDFLSTSYAVPLITSSSSHTAVLAEPLLYRDCLVGVITIDRNAHMRPFTEEDRKLIALFAAQAAVAIENARLYRAAVQRGAELDALLRATRSIMSGLDLQGILDRILTEAAGMAGTPHVRITLVDREARVLRVARVNGGVVPAGAEYPLESLSGLVVSSGEPVFNPNVKIDPRSYFGSRYDELGIVTYLGLPIKSRGEVVGVLILNTTAPRAYTPEELAYLTSFADQAAIALEHARLYQQTQEHAMSLEARVQQRTAELAQANRQLQEASQHKSGFLANMSHELRTPLNSILGFGQLLLEQTGETLSPKQTRFLTHIYNSGRHLLKLINDILDLSKVEAGKFVLQPERLPVAETLEDILVIARGLAHNRGQTIQVEIEPKLPWLYADPVRFKQILFNLLSNAVKFTPNDGLITVRAYQQEAGSRQQAAGSHVPSASSCSLPAASCSLPAGSFPLPALVIEVTDTGIGIRSEDMSRLFQEFVQLEAGKSQEGTGLGLALTKRLVELHGGWIWATSAGEGSGSTFTVLLSFSRPGESRV